MAALYNEGPETFSGSLSQTKSNLLKEPTTEKRNDSTIFFNVINLFYQQHEKFGIQLN